MSPDVTAGPPPDRQPASEAAPPGADQETSRLQAIASSFRDPRTRWTAIAACIALVVFPLIMAIGLLAILLIPGP